MRKFDYLFLNELRLPPQLRIKLDEAHVLNVILARHEQLYRNSQQADQLVNQKEEAFVNSVWASNAIEDILLPKPRVRQLLCGAPPQTAEEYAVAGYGKCLRQIFAHGYEFNRAELFAMHAQMLQGTGQPCGAYKTRENRIEAADEQGNRVVRWVPLSAAEAAEATQSLIEGYARATVAGVDRLLLIPCVAFDFLCIHPFEDGNGRMCRLITANLLSVGGYPCAQYNSYDLSVYNNLAEYNSALYASSVGWKENNNDYLPIIGNFINNLVS